VLPTPTVAPSSGTAKLRGPTGCVSQPFRAAVRGEGISRVDFLLDGKHYRTIKASDGHSVFSIKIRPRRHVAAHRVTARVRFKGSAHTAVRKLHLVYLSCPPGTVPRFAG
jgi:hypothetical protein